MPGTYEQVHVLSAGHLNRVRRIAMDKLIVRAYNVGFGDAFLISFPDQVPGGETETRHILIDVGSVSLVANWTACPVINPCATAAVDTTSEVVLIEVIVFCDAPKSGQTIA